jgi:hypothetical protein
MPASRLAKQVSRAKFSEIAQTIWHVGVEVVFEAIFRRVALVVREGFVEEKRRSREVTLAAANNGASSVVASGAFRA